MFNEKNLLSQVETHFPHGPRKYQIFLRGFPETRKAIPRYDFIGLSISLESQLTLGF